MGWLRDGWLWGIWMGMALTVFLLRAWGELGWTWAAVGWVIVGPWLMAGAVVAVVITAWAIGGGWR